MTHAVDFFCGMGGFTEGAEQVGVSVLLAANHNEQALTYHTRNHPHTRHLQQDLGEMDMRTLPDLSSGLLLASPACQGDSSASQPARKGTGGNHKPDAAAMWLKHTADRNTAWAVTTAAETARPHTIVVENVWRFTKRPLFPVWLQAFEALGYHVTLQKLNAGHFGSCQDRKRMVVVASLSGAIELDPGNPSNMGRLGDCLLPDSHPDHTWTAIDSKSERMRTRMRKAQNGGGSRCLWNNVSEADGRPMDAPFPTVTTKASGQLNILDGDRCRTIHARELARAQGFADTYAIPEGKTLASRLIGNAIDVNMARAVVAQVAEAI